MLPRNGADLLGQQEGVHPVTRLEHREGGTGHGRCPVEVGGGDPQDPLRVSAGCEDQEEQGGARALLPEDLVLERGGDRRWWALPRGPWVTGERAGHQVGSLGNASHRTAYGGVGLVPSYTGLVGRGREGVPPVPSTNIVTSPTSKSLSGRCRRWSAAFSSDIPPGCVGPAWFRYGAASMEWRALRACSRAGALLWRKVADPSPVSRRVSPMDRGRPDWLDVLHSIQYL